MSQFTVRVSQQDIADGIRGDVDRCPVAIAARRVFGEPIGVTATLLEGFSTPELTLPAEARAFVRNFEHSLPVSPFTFTVGEK